MKKIWTAMIGILWLSVGLTAAGVQLKVSSTRVAPGQSVKVKIEAEGKDVRFPSLRKIGEYPVENLRQSSSTQYKMINGQFSSSSKKILSFEFYPEKTVTLPPLKVTVDGKAYQTPSTKIEVSKEAGGQGGFSIRMKADKKEVYRGEPLVVTVDVAEPLGGAIVQMRYTPPAFQGFAAKPLGGERQIRKGNVTIHELRYLLTPEQAGARQIGPAAVRVGIRDLNAPADPFGIFGTPLKWVDLRSNLLTIVVKPLPADTDLVGHYSLKAKVDRKKVKANEPVNYTLEIVGEGSLEDLADPRFDIPGVTVYSDDAQVKSSIKEGKLYSRYTKKYVFISDRSFEIPSLKLKEFDYQTGKSRTLQTPTFSITVTGGGSAAPVAPPAGMKAQGPVAPRTRSQAGAKPVSSVPVKKSENLLEDPAYYARKAYEEKAARLPWYLAGAFTAGALLALILVRFWPRRGKRAILPGMKRRHYSLDEALKILYPHTNDDPEVEKVVRYLYQVKNGEKEVEIDREALDRLAAKYDGGEGK
ncbi:BatD family protein [Nitratifractor sp.]